MLRSQDGFRVEGRGGSRNDLTFLATTVGRPAQQFTASRHIKHRWIWRGSQRKYRFDSRPALKSRLLSICVPPPRRRSIHRPIRRTKLTSRNVTHNFAGERLRVDMMNLSNDTTIQSQPPSDHIDSSLAHQDCHHITAWNPGLGDGSSTLANLPARNRSANMKGKKPTNFDDMEKNKNHRGWRRIVRNFTPSCVLSPPFRHPLTSPAGLP
jgi:hypothetical protein